MSKPHSKKSQENQQRGRQRPWLRLAVAALAVTWAGTLSASPALAFSVEVHKWLTERALRGVVAIGPLMIPSEEQYMGFWLWFGKAMASPSGSPELDGQDPKRFVARYASPRAFDAFAIRGFLGLSQEPTPAVLGLETFDRDGELDQFNTVVRGSAQPDVDRRNQNRFAYDDKRKPLLAANGQRVPADPTALNMGPATGIASQAHAHYQLAADKPSDDPAILQTEPWNFAVRMGFDGPVETSAADMAQMHLDMAILMRAWAEEQQGSVGEYLALLWASAGLHYVQDAAGQLHTVQVGAYDVFVEAKLLWYRRGAMTAGGYLGTLPTFTSIGADLLRNLHFLAEAWMADQLDQIRLGKPGMPAIQKAWAMLDKPESYKPDPELMAALGTRLDPHLVDPFKVQPWKDGQGAASILVHTLAKLGSREGGAIYQAALAMADGELFQVGYQLDESLPLQARHLASGEDATTATETMAQLQAKSVARALTATRLYWHAYDQGNGDSAARRLRQNGLNRLEKQARLQKEWLAEVAKTAGHAKQSGAGAAGEKRPEFLVAVSAVALTLLAVVAWAWRRRRKGVA